MAPHTPQTLGAPRRSRGTPRYPARAPKWPPLPHTFGAPRGTRGRPSISPRGHASGQPEVGVEEAGEAFAGRAHLLRLLRDALQRQRPVEREPREPAARRAHGEPRPGQADGAEQADPRGDRQPREPRGGHRPAEARAGEPRVLGVVALALGGEPEPREPEGRQEGTDRPEPRA